MELTTTKNLSKMATLKQLINSLEGRGINYEIKPIVKWNGTFDADYNRIFEPTGEIQISFEKSNMIWYHFKVDSLDDNSYVDFIERYSQKTGQSVKAWKTGFKVLLSLGAFN